MGLWIDKLLPTNSLIVSSKTTGLLDRIIHAGLWRAWRPTTEALSDIAVTQIT